MERFAWALVPPKEAATTALVRVLTPVVVTVNVADVLPNGILTETGTFAD